MALADSIGTPVTEYTYEPYGQTTVVGTASTNSFQFTGRENDATGLYYYRARYYDPRAGRFLQPDPLGLSLGEAEAYAYVRNRPLTSTDPLGLYESPWLLRAVVPGQGAWDYAMTGFEAGDYGRGTLGLGTMLGEQALFVLTLGQAGVARQCAVSATEAGAAGGAARFVVDATGESSIFIANGTLEIGEHAAMRMTQRGLSLDVVENVVTTQTPFRYFHEGAWKTGYYDAAGRVFVGVVNNAVTTVIRNASPNYIRNLQAIRP